MKRRSFVLGGLVAAATFVGCKQEERCKHCGMKIDAKSAWTTVLIGMDDKPVHFDTPRCAFTYWRSGKMQAKDLRARDFYDPQGFIDSAELKFVVGSDVLGPMGPDLVPVVGQLADKFVKDHAAEKALFARDVTMDALNAIK